MCSRAPLDPPSTVVASITTSQFEAAWGMLKQAVQSVPLEQWRTGDVEHLVPARIACHVLETADYYMSPDPERFPWGGRFGVDWENGAREELPGQDDARDYLNEVRARVASWIAGLSDTGLLSPDAIFRSEGMSHLDRALYLLRHTQHHTGEMCAELRRRGLPRPPWR
jgi:uncharacterized damage-inducible protein DinB